MLAGALRSGCGLGTARPALGVLDMATSKREIWSLTQIALMRSGPLRCRPPPLRLTHYRMHEGQRICKHEEWKRRSFPEAPLQTDAHRISKGTANMTKRRTRTLCVLGGLALALGVCAGVLLTQRSGLLSDKEMASITGRGDCDICRLYKHVDCRKYGDAERADGSCPSEYNRYHDPYRYTCRVYGIRNDMK